MSRALATFQLLRHRRNEPQAFLYAFDLLELNGDGPTPRANRGAQGDAGQHPSEEPAGCATERAPGAPGGPVVFQHACKMGLEGIVSKRPTGEIIGACFGRRRSSRQLTIKKPSQCSVPCLSEPSLGFRASSAPTSVRPDWHLVSLRRPPGESETPFDFTR